MWYAEISYDAWIENTTRHRGIERALSSENAGNRSLPRCAVFRRKLSQEVGAGEIFSWGARSPS